MFCTRSKCVKEHTKNEKPKINRRALYKAGKDISGTGLITSQHSKILLVISIEKDYQDFEKFILVTVFS